ncbi:helix-turn-helix transcriptional regulator [Glutamicibacter ardleyensis]|uniref:helix-turn-helix transcriptional regulator n=1 Tax=Glutamicibacter ardleyensis TaxID=225894 RepID=UPI003FD360B5
MTDILKNLPSIIREHRFAQYLGLAPNGLVRMASEGTLPFPIALDGGKPVWMEEGIIDWFSHLQNSQAAYASIGDELGIQELTQQGIYVCPARSSHHIGQRRPRTLVLHTRGQEKNAKGKHEVHSYDVEFAQTQDGVMGEELITYYGNQAAQLLPWSSIRPDADYPLTVFKLNMESRLTIQLDRVWQRGGTVSYDSLGKAILEGHATHFKGGIAHR